MPFILIPYLFYGLSHLVTSEIELVNSLGQKLCLSNPSVEQLKNCKIMTNYNSHSVCDTILCTHPTALVWLQNASHAHMCLKENSGKGRDVSQLGVQMETRPFP